MKLINNFKTHRAQVRAGRRLTGLAAGLRSSATVLVVSLFLQAATGQTWETHFAGPGHCRSVLIDPYSTETPPGVFVGGIGTEAPSVQLINPDGSVDPSAQDDAAVTCNQLGYDPYLNRLYSLGTVLRESADGGATWTTAPVSGFARLAGFASDGAGNVWISGRLTDSSGKSRGVVYGRDSTGRWAMVKEFSISRQNCSAEKMHIRGSWLYVAGRSADKWAVHRGALSNGGIAWEAPYTWAPKGQLAGAKAVTSDANGSIYVFGSTGSELAPVTWVLQKSVNQGKDWSIVATFSDSPQSNRAQDLAFDASGNLHLVGGAVLGPKTGPVNYKWMVRTCRADGQWLPAWFPFGNAASVDPISEAMGISVDREGTVYVGGSARDASGNAWSVVQRLVVPR